LAEKAHEVRRAEADDGGMDEVLVNTFEICSGLEQNIGGHFGLVDAAPVAVELCSGDDRLSRVSILDGKRPVFDHVR